MAKIKLLSILALIIIINLNAYSQKSIILKGKTKYDLEYYFDSNKEVKETIKKSNGYYELKIPKKTKFEKVTIHEYGDDMCTQVLTIAQLLNYSKAFKSDTIINDITYISSCLRIDMMATPEYEDFVAKWKNDEVEMLIYTDGEFYLKYIEKNIQFQREGTTSIIDSNTILLKSRTIRNSITNTYIDNSETIKYVLKDGILYSEKNGDILKKVKY
jgi:hypothetical protein